MQLYFEPHQRALARLVTSKEIQLASCPITCVEPSMIVVVFSKGIPGSHIDDSYSLDTDIFSGCGSNFVLIPTTLLLL